MRTSPSPLRSHVLNPLNLAPANGKYDPKRVKCIKTRQGKKKQFKFESAHSTRKWDEKRAARLIASGRDDAQLFGLWLQVSTKKRELPLSLSSSFYYRLLRRRLCAALARWFAESNDAITPFTCVPPSLAFKTGELDGVRPEYLKAYFRNRLVTAGVERVGGKLFAAVHAEFDGQYYQFHFHGVATGKKAIALRTLCARSDLQPTLRVKRPLQFEADILVTDTANLIGWLTYCLKSYWPYKPSYADGEGKLRRSRVKRALPADQEVEFLMWMGRRNLGELVLLHGARLTDF